jgi:hypothetical protein
MKRHDPGDDSPTSKSSDRPSAATLGGLRGAEIFFTVFATGAAVMVVEILGTRIIAPVFGVNLLVWSALLAVTLCSLAIGYFVGGKVVDRLPQPSVLSFVVLSSAVLVGLIMPLRRPILGLAEGLGFRLGPLVSAAALFVPALNCGASLTALTECDGIRATLVGARLASRAFRAIERRRRGGLPRLSAQLSVSDAGFCDEFDER